MAVAVLVLVVAGAAPPLARSLRSPAQYIAYIGKYRTPNFDDLHVNALRYFLAERMIGGVHVPIKAIRLTDALGAREAYNQLTQDRACIAVIDNSWFSDISDASSIIADADLPVFSLNADHGGRAYNSRALFLGHDDFVPGALIAYLRAHHSSDYIVFIGERSYWSTDVCVQELTKDPLTLSADAIIDVATDTVTDSEWGHLLGRLHEHSKTARQGGQQVVILANVHNQWGQRLLAEMDRNHGGGQAPLENALVIGGPYISPFGGKAFEGRNGCKVLMLTNPRDAVSSRTLAGMRALQARYGDELVSRRNAGLFVERCSRTIQVMRALAEEGGERWGRDPRGVIREGFRRLRGSACVLTDAVLRFDTDLRVRQQRRLEWQDCDGLRSHEHQLDADNNIVPNVYIGVRVRSIREIDVQRRRFAAECDISVRYAREYEDRVGHPMPELEFPNGEGVRVTKAAVASSGAHHFRCEGEFVARMKAKDFPFDSQELPIQVTMETLGEQMAVTYDERELAGVVVPEEDDVDPAWRVCRIVVGVEEMAVNSRGGRIGGDAAPKTYITARALVERRLLRPVGTIVLPLVGLGVSSILLVFLRDLRISHVGEISVGAFVGFVGYAIAYTTLAPATVVVSRSDGLLYATCAVTILVLLIIVSGNVFMGKMLRDSYALTWFWVVRGVLGLGYVGTTIWVLLG